MHLLIDASPIRLVVGRLPDNYAGCDHHRPAPAPVGTPSTSARAGAAELWATYQALRVASRVHRLQAEDKEAAYREIATRYRAGGRADPEAARATEQALAELGQACLAERIAGDAEDAAYRLWHEAVASRCG